MLWVWRLLTVAWLLGLTVLTIWPLAAESVGLPPLYGAQMRLLRCSDALERRRDAERAMEPQLQGISDRLAAAIYLDERPGILKRAQLAHDQAIADIEVFCK